MIAPANIIKNFRRVKITFTNQEGDTKSIVVKQTLTPQLDDIRIDDTPPDPIDLGPIDFDDIVIKPIDLSDLDFNFDFGDFGFGDIDLGFNNVLGDIGYTGTGIKLPGAPGGSRNRFTY